MSVPINVTAVVCDSSNEEHKIVRTIDSATIAVRASDSEGYTNFKFTSCLQSPYSAVEIYERGFQNSLAYTLSGANSFVVCVGARLLPGYLFGVHDTTGEETPKVEAPSGGEGLDTPQVKGDSSESSQDSVFDIISSELFKWIKEKCTSTTSITVRVVAIELSLTEDTIRNLIPNVSLDATIDDSEDGETFAADLAEHPVFGFVFPKVHPHEVQTQEAARDCTRDALARARPGRHVIVSFQLIKRQFDGDTGDVLEMLSQLCIVNLSMERARPTIEPLHSLQRCVDQLLLCKKGVLSQTNVSNAIRSTVLTTYLSQFVGGNSYASVVLCVQSDIGSKADTLRTLQFGKQCMQIETTPIAQEQSYRELIHALHEENNKLRAEKETKAEEKQQNQTVTPGVVHYQSDKKSFWVISPNPLAHEEGSGLRPLFFCLPKGLCTVGSTDRKLRVMSVIPDSYSELVKDGVAQIKLERGEGRGLEQHHFLIANTEEAVLLHPLEGSVTCRGVEYNVGAAITVIHGDEVEVGGILLRLVDGGEIIFKEPDQKSISNPLSVEKDLKIESLVSSLNSANELIKQLETTEESIRGEVKYLLAEVEVLREQFAASQREQDALREKVVLLEGVDDIKSMTVMNPPNTEQHPILTYLSKQLECYRRQNSHQHNLLLFHRVECSKWQSAYKGLHEKWKKYQQDGHQNSMGHIVHDPLSHSPQSSSRASHDMSKSPRDSEKRSSVSPPLIVGPLKLRADIDEVPPDVNESASTSPTLSSLSSNSRTPPSHKLSSRSKGSRIPLPAATIEVPFDVPFSHPQIHYSSELITDESNSNQEIEYITDSVPSTGGRSSEYGTLPHHSHSSVQSAFMRSRDSTAQLYRSSTAEKRKKASASPNREWAALTVKRQTTKVPIVSAAQAKPKLTTHPATTSFTPLQLNSGNSNSSSRPRQFTPSPVRGVRKPVPGKVTENPLSLIPNKSNKPERRTSPSSHISTPPPTARRKSESPRGARETSKTPPRDKKDKIIRVPSLSDVAEAVPTAGARVNVSCESYTVQRTTITRTGRPARSGYAPHPSVVIHPSATAASPARTAKRAAPSMGLHSIGRVGRSVTPVKTRVETA